MKESRRGARGLVAAAAAANGAGALPSAAPGADGVYDVVVVGAGISGLVTAQALATQHAGTVKSLLVTEARERVGGNITSMAGGGYVWEEGPNSFQPNDAMLLAAVEAGVADQLVFGDPTAPRFVFWEKKLRPTPSGPDALTFDLMSLWGKIRAGLGAIGIANGSMPGELLLEGLGQDRGRGARAHRCALACGGSLHAWRVLVNTKH